MISWSQVSKALLAEYVACKSKGRPFKGLGLEHMNESSPPVIPSKLSSDILRSIQFQVLNFLFYSTSREFVWDRLETV